MKTKLSKKAKPYYLTLFSLLCLISCKENINVPNSETKLPMVSTYAGQWLPGFVNGEREFSSFYSPTSIAVDIHGTVYIADYHNHAIRTITPAGVVCTMAGGLAGDTNKNLTAFNGPAGITVDEKGNVFVADNDNQKVKKLRQMDLYKR